MTLLFPYMEISICLLLLLVVLRRLETIFWCIYRHLLTWNGIRLTKSLCSTGACPMLYGGALAPPKFRKVQHCSTSPNAAYLFSWSAPLFLFVINRELEKIKGDRTGQPRLTDSDMITNPRPIHSHHDQSGATEGGPCHFTSCNKQLVVFLRSSFEMLQYDYIDVVVSAVSFF